MLHCFVTCYFRPQWNEKITYGISNDVKGYSWSPLLYLCAIWYILTLRASMFGTEYAANLRINSELELIWVILIAVLITIWILGQIWIWGCWSISVHSNSSHFSETLCVGLKLSSKCKLEPAYGLYSSVLAQI